MNPLDFGDDALSYIRKESLDLYNRIHSIEEDVEFVLQVHEAYSDVPLLPNLRCGAWYTDPEMSTPVPAYFKSTDGHFNNWGFNLRRANIHLLGLLEKKHSMILVDSTRSGKRIPDALSKTVPIWCAVINRALLLRYPDLAKDEQSHWDSDLYTPPAAVSTQEHHQIEQRLDGWAEALAMSSFALPRLPRPLRPIWITPATTTFPALPTSPSNLGNFLPVVCVSASKKVDHGVERRSGGYSYVQGSGDDHELWGMGLTPSMFWRNREALLRADRSELPDLVKSIVTLDPTVELEHMPSGTTPVAKIGGRLQLCAVSELSSTPTAKDGVRHLILTSSSQETMTPTRKVVSVIAGKKGQSYFLSTVLPECIAYIREQLFGGLIVVVACDTGKDLSIGVTLAAIALFFNEDGSLKSAEGQESINKSAIQTRLQWIIASRPQANPSRATIKRVNEFLLTPSIFRPSAAAPTTA